MKFNINFHEPPIVLGMTWTGHSLLNYYLEQCDNAMKKALIEHWASVGGDAFRAKFEAKASELNARTGAAIHAEARAMVSDALARLKVN